MGRANSRACDFFFPSHFHSMSQYMACIFFIRTDPSRTPSTALLEWASPVGNLPMASMTEMPRRRSIEFMPMDHEIDDSHLGTKYVENRDDAAGWQSLGERIPMEEEDQASPQLPPARSGAYQNCQQPEPNHQQQQHVEASRAWGGHQAPATRPASSAFSSRPPFPPTRSSTTAHMNASVYHRATGPDRKSVV